LIKNIPCWAGRGLREFDKVETMKDSKNFYIKSFVIYSIFIVIVFIAVIFFRLTVLKPTVRQFRSAQAELIGSLINIPVDQRVKIEQAHWLNSVGIGWYKKLMPNRKSLAILSDNFIRFNDKSKHIYNIKEGNLYIRLHLASLPPFNLMGTEEEMRNYLAQNVCTFIQDSRACSILQNLRSENKFKDIRETAKTSFIFNPANEPDGLEKISLSVDCSSCALIDIFWEFNPEYVSDNISEGLRLTNQRSPVVLGVKLDEKRHNGWFGMYGFFIRGGFIPTSPKWFLKLTLLEIDKISGVLHTGVYYIIAGLLAIITSIIINRVFFYKRHLSSLLKAIVFLFNLLLFIKIVDFTLLLILLMNH
jgi:hypothetical protein